MFDLTEGMEYEDQEMFRQVMLKALGKLTAMQMHCLLLSLLGLTQEQIGEVLGIGQAVVARHFGKALSKVTETADVMRN
jgi:DNA-binding CsgD family transcriptional regulator